MKGAIVVACALLPAIACGRSAAQTTTDAQSTAPIVEGSAIVVPPGSPMLRQIRQETVTLRELPTEEVVANGKIEANPNRVSKVVLPVTGRISNVLVKTGDAVASGQPLLTIESPDADAATSSYVSAQAAELQGQAALAKAQADYDRAADLFEHDAIAKKEVLGASSALAQARATLQQANAAREQALRRLGVLGLKPGDFDQQVVVRSPLSGKVLDLNVVRGEFRNDANAPLMTIADLSTVWVTSQVPESDIRLVRGGERLQIRFVAYPGEVFDARVARIADTVDPQTRTIKVHAVMVNPDGRFRPEMYCSIHHIESVAVVPVVPAGAIVQSGGHPVVFVETAARRFERRPVSIGKPSAELVRIASGVHAGERVVVDGALLLNGLFASRPHE